MEVNILITQLASFILYCMLDSTFQIGINIRVLIRPDVVIIEWFSTLVTETVTLRGWYLWEWGIRCPIFYPYTPLTRNG